MGWDGVPRGGMEEGEGVEEEAEEVEEEAEEVEEEARQSLTAESVPAESTS